MASLNEFLERVEASGLLNAEALASLGKKFTGDTATEFGDYLIAEHALTRWQTDNLLAGRYKGFALDQYTLLDHLSDDAKHIRYLAKDENGTLVVILATPRHKSDTARKTAYSVEKFVP